VEKFGFKEDYYLLARFGQGRKQRMRR